LYSKNKNFDFSKNLKGGIFSFRNLNEEFLAINFSSNYRKEDTIITAEKLEEFIAELKVYIKEIYNPEIAFIEPADLKY
jgi:hypothetical protein